MEIKTHPIYNKYEFNTNGHYRRIGSSKWLTGYLNSGGYSYCTISNRNEPPQSVFIHRAVWTCFKGEIPEGYEIDHLNRLRNDNRLCNLEAVTIGMNRKRSQTDDHKLRQISKYAHKMKRKIKSIRLDKNESHIFESKSACAKYFGCSPALIYFICEGLNNVKTFGGIITFKYADENEEVNIVIPHEKKGKSKYASKEDYNEAQKKMKKERIGKLAYEKKTFKTWLKDYKNIYKLYK